MDKLTAMRTFVAVLDAGSFSGAAVALGVPKTRVSQRVQELEAALSVRLLYRTTRALSLTDEGRIYHEKCVQILEEIDATETALGRKHETPTGRLRVSCMSLLARSLLLPRIAEFQRLYPNVQITLSVSDRLANLTETGFDCALRGGKLENSSMISRHLGEFRFGLFASPDWVARRGLPDQVGDLTADQCIMMTSQKDGQTRPWDLRGPEAACTIAGPAGFETDDDQAALDAALAGAGIVLCAEFAAAQHLRDGKLVRILPQWSGVNRPIYFIYPTRRFLAAKLRCFLDWSTAVIHQTS